jgi:hypothetical protein
VAPTSHIDTPGSAPAPRHADDDEFARRGLRKLIASLADELAWAVEEGLDAERLHDVIALWEINAEDLDYNALVDRGRPTSCGDCETDVAPFDEDGRPVEATWEWFMVRDEVWKAAQTDGVRYLCVGCIEERLGRQLTRDDFSDLGINDPSWLKTARLRARLEATAS